MLSRGGVPLALGVSPELMLRPSLSAQLQGERCRHPQSGVAGAYAPAFVERGRTGVGLTFEQERVAGAYAPAFVERLGA